MMKLYAGETKGDIPQICLNELQEPLFHYFSLPDVREAARKYNGSIWDYQQRMSVDMLVLHK